MSYYLKVKICLINVVSGLIKLLWIFPVIEDRIMFISYNGKNFGDSPKAVYDYFLKLGSDYELLWAFHKNIINTQPPRKKVSIGSLRFYKLFVTSKYIIVNDSIYTFLPVRKSQILINTWHGGGWFKKIGLTDNGTTAYNKWFFKRLCDRHSYFVASSEYFVNTVLNSSFGYHGKILRIGMPRNSEIFDITEKHRKQLRRIFSNNDDILIVLYAPTHRRYKNEIPPLDIERLSTSLKNRFGRDVIILYRAHHLIDSFPLNSDVIINVTSYPNMQELLLSCDVLISDYSSCMWEGALLRKLIIVYAPDAQQYIDNRGLFLDINEWPALICFSNDDIEKQIDSFDESQYYYKLDKLVALSKSYENKDSAKTMVNLIINKQI